MPDNGNPQGPSSSLSKFYTNKAPPTCVFDLFLDLPHPAASARDRAKIINPPATDTSFSCSEMCNPDNLTRLAKFAFPDYDESDDQSQSQLRQQKQNRLTQRGQSVGADLMKHDVYLTDFAGSHHTFSLLLSDSRTRVHAHVRRYLPPHGDAATRPDVGRRRPRAMVVLTRVLGGERFYSSVLKTVEAVTAEARAGRRGRYAAEGKDAARGFLFALFEAHAELVTRYAELRRHGLCLQFGQTPETLARGETSADTARHVLEENDDLFRLTLEQVEFGWVGSNNKQKRSAGTSGKFRIDNDTLKFYLPVTLQPGFECLPQKALPEDVVSPIIPLLRYIGPSHFVRVLSALLCERRIILISKGIARLSTCVRAASSVLAQGLLMWKHVLITVVPPHMMKFLSSQTPYLVGVLHKFAPQLGKVNGLSDVLCVNLDKNELKTLNMPDPKATVPDILKRAGRKSSDGMSAAEYLARDLDEIMKADSALWESKDTKSSGGAAQLDLSNSLTTSSAAANKSGVLHRMKNIKMADVGKSLKAIKDSKSKLEDTQEYTKHSVDAAVAFGRMIRNNLRPDNVGDSEESRVAEEEDELANPKYSAPSHDTSSDVGIADSSENEGGEEDVRAALTSFFVHMFGVRYCRAW